MNKCPKVLARELTESSSLSSFVGFLRASRTKVIALTCAYVFLLSVIGIQNVPYWDDALRRATGITRWGRHDGRWGSEFVYMLLNQGAEVIDLGITTFVLSGVILALASLIVVYALVGQRTNWFTMVMALAFGLNPWMLNALAFRFDGPLISLALLFAVSTVLFYQQSYSIVLVSYAILTFLTTNFFQPFIGLALALLMTKLLLGWSSGYLNSQEAIRRLGAGIGGTIAGAFAYFLQTRLVNAGRFDAAAIIQNPLLNLAQNIPRYLITFVRTGTPAWNGLTALVILLFIVYLWNGTIRKKYLALIITALCGILTVVASGNLLLLWDTFLIGTPRFHAPLAMAIAMYGIVLSTWRPPRRTAFVAMRTVILVFSYLWLSVLFVFAQTLREQQDSLRFQVSGVMAGLIDIYQPGDKIYFDSRVFANSQYLANLANRFPIFRNGIYYDPLDSAFGFLHYRIADIAGLDHTRVSGDWLTASSCHQGDHGRELAVTGPRWEAFRGDTTTVCIAFPDNFFHVLGVDGGYQIDFNAAQFPFSPGQISGDPVLRPGDFQLAVWSVDNPADVQWLDPQEMDHQVVRFIVAPPAPGWTGDLLAAHLFLRNEQIHEHIWTSSHQE